MVMQFSDLVSVVGLADANTSAMDRYRVVTKDVQKAQ